MIKRFQIKKTSKWDTSLYLTINIYSNQLYIHVEELLKQETAIPSASHSYFYIYITLQFISYFTPLTDLDLEILTNTKKRITYNLLSILTNTYNFDKHCHPHIYAYTKTSRHGSLLFHCLNCLLGLSKEGLHRNVNRMQKIVELDHPRRTFVDELVWFPLLGWQWE